MLQACFLFIHDFFTREELNLIGSELGSETLPTFVIVFVLAAVHGIGSQLHKVGTLKHKCHGPLQFDGFQLRRTRHLECLAVWSVGSHTAMQRGTTRTESFLLGLIFTQNQAHKFTHTIAVVIGRTESVLVNHPTLWEHNKVHSRLSWCISWASE